MHDKGVNNCTSFEILSTKKYFTKKSTSFFLRYRRPMIDINFIRFRIFLDTLVNKAL